MTLRTHIWNDLRSPEIVEARDAGAVIVVPLGSIEQHSSHLPLNTDIFSATSVVDRAARLCRQPPVLVANVVQAGFSPHHMEHAGTISLSLTTFNAVIRDVVESIFAHGFRKVLFVNGHGGNIAPLTAVLNELTSEGLPVVSCSYWDLIKVEIAEEMEGWRKAVGHAGEFETSFLLHLKPESVDMQAAGNVQSPPWNPELSHDVFAELGASFPAVFVKESSGLLGDAARGTERKGAALFEVAVQRLVKLIEVLAGTETIQAR
ncbi:MAG: creatininase family protein [Trueperaceae bacterium]